jgi:hypothetical protein
MEPFNVREESPNDDLWIVCDITNNGSTAIWVEENVIACTRSKGRELLQEMKDLFPGHKLVLRKYTRES